MVVLVNGGMCWMVNWGVDGGVDKLGGDDNGWGYVNAWGIRLDGQYETPHPIDHSMIEPNSTKHYPFTMVSFYFVIY